MFPRISDLLNSLFKSEWSIPLSTYKFFLITAFLAAGIIVYLELSRKEKLGEIPANSSKETLFAMLLAVVFGLLGARILSALEYLDEFVDKPGAGFFLRNGQSFYGGLILASITILLYARYRKVHYTHAMDIAAPAIAIGYAVGRMGCHLSGDGCWGVENTAVKPAWLGFLPDWAWACSYPHNALQSGILMPGCISDHCHVLPNPVYPTSLYESMIAFILFLILWEFRKRIKIAGLLMIICILSLSASRFLIEMIRINPRYELAGFQFSQAQIISMVIFLFSIPGAILLILRSFKDSTS
ncbi:MAG: prolipoprotein diacylglyceryl transferase [Bacteroidales bacterium]|nr:prolipoprotein diacylglyceryl transferase [Bacteroidales bacterium]